MGYAMKAGNDNGTRRLGMMLGFACALAALALQAGCRDARHAGKYEVNGAVTWNGEPIQKGFVTFHPEGGKSDEAGPITNGRYLLYAHPGQNGVSISAEKVSGFNQGMNQPNVVQFIPPEYNTASKLSAEVVPDGTNSFDFSLTGKEVGS